MPHTRHPRLVLAVALLASVSGVIGESLAGTALMHLVSVVCVVLGLLVAVVVAPNIAGDDVERAGPDHTALRNPRQPRDPRDPHHPRDPRDDAATTSVAPQRPRV